MLQFIDFYCTIIDKNTHKEKIMFHQPHNTFGTKIYNAFFYDDAVYSMHFHKSFEVWYCASGHADACVDEKSFVFSAGQYMMVFPFVKHSFSVKPPSKMWVAVFSGDFIPELENISQSQKPEIATFRVDDAVQRYVEHALINSGFLSDEQQKPSFPLNTQNIFSIKSGLYAISGAFLQNVSFLPVTKSYDVVTEIIRYIENNFTADITLKSTADALGYNYQHISRVFQRALGINFRSLINQYRFDYACKLLEQSNVSVTQAALDAGFQSVRNFNRIYREKTGHAPKIHD